MELPTERRTITIHFLTVYLIHHYTTSDQVCEVGKAFFKETLATSFNDPRLNLIYDDAARYLREEGSKQNYDVIICDSSDPVGTAHPTHYSSIIVQIVAILPTFS